jgi:hypothetical protein
LSPGTVTPLWAERILGEVVYASFDGGQVVLRAPRGAGDHFVGLRPEMMVRLLHFAALRPPEGTTRMLGDGISARATSGERIVVMIPRDGGDHYVILDRDALESLAAYVALLQDNP